MRAFSLILSCLLFDEFDYVCSLLVVYIATLWFDANLFLVQLRFEGLPRTVINVLITAPALVYSFNSQLLGSIFFLVTVVCLINLGNVDNLWFDRGHGFVGAFPVRLLQCRVLVILVVVKLVQFFLHSLLP